MKVSGTAGILPSLRVLTAMEPPVPTRLIPEDKGVSAEEIAVLKRRGARKAFHGAARFALGMPCGGVAAGQLYVLGDGTLGGWHVDGRLNATGWGATSYKIKPPVREVAQGFVCRVKRDGGAGWNECVLADRENGGGFSDIEFYGEYPIAEVHYKGCVDKAFPLRIEMKVGSPFIPLSSKDSSLPCTMMRFTLRNTSGRRVEGELVGFLENGLERVNKGEAPFGRRNRVCTKAGVSTVRMDSVACPSDGEPREDRTLFDFESPGYAGWEVKGNAFGTTPAAGRIGDQQPVEGFEGSGLVNSYAGTDDATGQMLSPAFTIDRRFIALLVGGGGHAGKTCVNLLVNGKVVRSATGSNRELLEWKAWDVRDLQGAQAQIQIVDAHKGGWGHINADSIRLVDTLPAAAQRHSPESLTFGTLAIGARGVGVADAGDPRDRAASKVDAADLQTEVKRDASESLTGAVKAGFSIAPGGSEEITFVVAWHFPNLHTGQGVMYSNWFADASAVVDYVFENRDRLVEQTELFRKTWYEDTSLPWWLAQRLFMPTANLATGTAQWWKNGRFWGWEGVGCCSGTCTHVWNYSHAEARLFPDLARSTRLMQDMGSGFDPQTGRVAFRGEVNNGSAYAGDGQSGTVLKCYREHLCSADGSFLKNNWERIRKVLEYQIGRDSQERNGTARQPQGVIDVAQPNTYDIDFEGPNTFVGSLYLASLLAGAAMAEDMGDRELAERYRRIARSGREFSERNLFRNGYFVQKIPEGADTKFQYGTGCLSDQLFGQNWARCLDLGTVYDETMVRSALKSVYRYNFCPAVGQYNARFPAERDFAVGREAGMFICTWPEGGRPDEPVRYRDEVWTGCEYQAAGGMLWEGLIDEALVMIKAIDDRYDGVSHNPWNEVECGDHYARAMASYGAFQALCGYSYDGPKGCIGIAPRLSPDRFAAFFSGAEGWGLATQIREEKRQVNRYEVRWGSIRIASVRVTLPEDFNKECRAGVRVKGQEIEATVSRGGVVAMVELKTPTVIAAGDAIEVTVW